MKIITKLYIALTLFTPSLLFAAQFKNPLKFNTLQEFLVGFLNAIILISIPFIVLAVVYSGFLFVSSQGNETKLVRAKNMLLYTLIGASLILGAKVLAVAIQATIAQISVIDVIPFIV